MYRKTINKMAFLVTMILIVVGCTARVGGSEERGGLTTVNIELQPEGFVATRSSFTWGDSQINDIQVVVTEDDGSVYDVIYSHSVSGISFTGLTGHHYNATAVANLGHQVSVSEMSGYADLAHMPGTADIARNGVPMCSAANAGITLSAGTNSLTITMVRMLARVDLSIDRSRLGSADGYSVQSVRIYNSPNKSFDSSSADDIASLNSGRSVSLYAYENMQGTLLPGNTDPWAKVPGQLGSASDKCSYLEVKCSYSFHGKSCDDITYRMYLGQDATTNFDIKRNTVYRLTLVPTEEEIYGERGSWKIESGLWDDRSPVSLAFVETAKSIYVDGPNAGENGKWTPELVVTYADGTSAHVNGILTSVRPATASVSGMTVTGKSAGITDINGSYTEYGVTVNTTVPATVTVTDPLLGLKLDPSILHMTAGASYSEWMVTAVYPSGDKGLTHNANGLTWNLESSAHVEKHGRDNNNVDDFILMTSQGDSGNIEVVCDKNTASGGTATLTASFTDNGITKSASSAIDVTEKIIDHYSFEVSPGNLRVTVGEQRLVSASLFPIYTDGTKGKGSPAQASWRTESDSKRVVSNSVLNSGTKASSFWVTGVGEGTDLIIATYTKDGTTYTGFCNVTVTKSTAPDIPDDPDEPDEPDNPDEPDEPDGPEITYGYRLEIVNGGQLGVGDSATFIVKLYTDIYHDGVLFFTDQTGSVIDNSRVGWGFGSTPEDVTDTDPHAVLTQGGVITGTAVGDCTVIATLKTNPDVFATKDIEVIESSAGIDLSIQWGGTWARIDIGF